MTARALRNNNPGNLNKGQPWQGLAHQSEMTPDQAKEDRFAVFRTPAYGFRALCKTLLTYQITHGLNTVEKIIHRWAPMFENNTSGYVQRVAQAIGKGPHDIVDLKDPVILAGFAKAIATVESGGWPWLDDDLQAGVTMALS